jgi:hypothetical protein
VTLSVLHQKLQKSSLYQLSEDARLIGDRSTNCGYFLKVFVICISMEYEDYGKKMLIYASVAIVGIFFALQALFGIKCFT